MRTTIKQVRAQVEQLNQLLDRPDYMTKVANGGYIINPGHISVDYNPIYGGCQLQETVNDGGGVDDRLFGLSWGHRLSLKEMSIFLDGLIAGLEFKP